MDMNLLFSAFTPSDITHTSESQDDASAVMEPGVDAMLFPAHDFLDLGLALDPLPMDTMDKVLFPSIGAGIPV
ncbi:hypothetical protein MBRA1_000746 [Malassezia brasiliensis]|uniref:Uncharacterized protein n=1 Tax=Malassezia brasiliensis TaxID=1821822 RepID=A0AAF0DR33_9BASI|nr:hypothetical protein MBRA1_000746 [Malassezia brasiliensis]